MCSINPSFSSANVVVVVGGGLVDVVVEDVDDVELDVVVDEVVVRVVDVVEDVVEEARVVVVSISNVIGWHLFFPSTHSVWSHGSQTSYGSSPKSLSPVRHVPSSQ